MCEDTPNKNPVLPKWMLTESIWSPKLKLNVQQRWTSCPRGSASTALQPRERREPWTCPHASKPTASVYRTAPEASWGPQVAHSLAAPHTTCLSVSRLPRPKPLCLVGLVQPHIFCPSTGFFLCDGKTLDAFLSFDPHTDLSGTKCSSHYTSMTQIRQ